VLPCPPPASLAVAPAGQLFALGLTDGGVLLTDAAAERSLELRACGGGGAGGATGAAAVQPVGVCCWGQQGVGCCGWCDQRVGCVRPSAAQARVGPSVCAASSLSIGGVQI
jgi:hypothetical protein